MRYKLIKEYPNSLPLETILTYDKDSGFYMVEINPNEIYYIDEDVIKSYPEYWIQIDDSTLLVDEIKHLIQLEIFRWDGISGGQHVNKVDSAVRLTCNEFNFRVECGYHRSTYQNKEACLDLLQLFIDKLPISVKQHYKNESNNKNISS